MHLNFLSVRDSRAVLQRQASVKRSGVARFRLYDLRHTSATRAAESGVDLVTLAAMLGHSKIVMVTRYAHPTEQHQAEAMKRMQQHKAAM